LGKIAEDVSAAKSKANTSQGTETMFENAIYEYSSVNLDQEMSHMLEVQKAYQASAKMITVVDEMLQTVINLR
jgi:flagellar hook-associated protein FlgK